MDRSVRLRIVVQIWRADDSGNFSWVDELCKAPNGELIPIEIAGKVADKAYELGYAILDLSSLQPGPD